MWCLRRCSMPPTSLAGYIKLKFNWFTYDTEQTRAEELLGVRYPFVYHGSHSDCEARSLWTNIDGVTYTDNEGLVVDIQGIGMHNPNSWIGIPKLEFRNGVSNLEYEIIMLDYQSYNKTYQNILWHMEPKEQKLGFLNAISESSNQN